MVLNNHFRMSSVLKRDYVSENGRLVLLHLKVILATDFFLWSMLFAHL